MESVAPVAPGGCSGKCCLLGGQAPSSEPSSSSTSTSAVATGAAVGVSPGGALRGVLHLEADALWLYLVGKDDYVEKDGGIWPVEPAMPGGLG